MCAMVRPGGTGVRIRYEIRYEDRYGAPRGSRRCGARRAGKAVQALPAAVRAGIVALVEATKRTE